MRSLRFGMLVLMVALAPVDAASEPLPPVARVVVRDLPDIDPSKDLPRRALHDRDHRPPWRTQPRGAPAPKDPTPAAADSPPPLATFSSYESRAGTPPDTQGAVGPNHVVVLTNGFFRVHTRSGDVLKTASVEDLFDVAWPFYAGDSTLQFDPWRNRWVATSMVDRAYGTAPRQLRLAVSETADPLDAWTVRELPAPVSGLDQPRAAVTAAQLVISADTYSDATDDVGGHIWIADAAQLGAQDGGLVWHGNAPFHMTPAAVAKGEPERVDCLVVFDGTLWLLRYWPKPNGQWGAAPYLEVKNLPFSLGSSDYAWPQEDSDQKIVAAGMQPIRGVVQGGLSWWALQPGAIDLQAPAVTWLAVDADGKLAKYGTLGGDNNQVARTYPSLALTSAGDLLLGYSRLMVHGYVSAAYAAVGGECERGVVGGANFHGGRRRVRARLQRGLARLPLGRLFGHRRRSAG